MAQKPNPVDTTVDPSLGYLANPLYDPSAVLGALIDTNPNNTVTVNETTNVTKIVYVNVTNAVHANGANNDVQLNVNGAITGDDQLQFNTSTKVLTSNNEVLTGNLTIYGIANLGSVGSVKITGGADGDFLRTDGNGGLSWGVSSDYQLQSDWNAVAGVTKILNKPTLSTVATTGNYSDLTNTPNLSGYATSSNLRNLGNAVANISFANLSGAPNMANYVSTANLTWNNVTGKPTFAAVAVSGSYNNLTDKPTIPSITGLATTTYVDNSIANINIPNTDWANIPNKPAFANVATSGDYNDLANVPTIPTIAGLATTMYVDDSIANIAIPANISQLTNDSGYITSSYSGNLSLHELTVTGNATIDSNLKVSGNGLILGDLHVDGNINFVGNVRQVSGNAGKFYGDVNGIGALYAGIPTGYSQVANPVIQASASINDYVQINFQNINSGNVASTEWVATADNGDDTTNYIDMGIAGSGWDGTQTNSLGDAAQADDGWLYVQGGTGGGNLILGTSSAGTQVKFVVGGPGNANIVAHMDPDGLHTDAIFTDNYYFANGAPLTVSGGGGGGSNYTDSNVAAYLPNYAGNLNTVNHVTTNSFTLNGTGNVNVNNGTIYSNSSVYFLGGSAGALSFGASATTAIITIGGGAQTSNIVIGRSIANSNTYIQTSNLPSGNTKNVFIGTGGLGGSNTNIKIGPDVGTGNVTYGTNTSVTIGNSLNVSGNVTGSFIGNGSQLTNIPSANIVGQVANALVSGTVYTNAQPNITSLGTLISANITGNLSVGNISLTGNVSSNLNVSGNIIGGGVRQTTSTIKPNNPIVGDQWYNASNDTLYQYVYDGASSYWIDITGPTFINAQNTTKVSAYVNAGVFLIMDNIKAAVTTSGYRGLCLATVSGTFTSWVAGTYGMNGGGSGGNSAGLVVTTSTSASLFSWSFTGTGDMSTYIINDTTNSRVYRITLMIGASFNNNFISIERLI